MKAVAEYVADAVELGPQPCEAHPVVSVPRGSAELAGQPRCGQPPAGLYMIGCLHEHIIELWLCASCASAGPVLRYCGECFDVDGHVCPVITTAAGAS